VRGVVVLSCFLIGACRHGDVPPGYQGVVELDERLLSFEVPGRLVTVPVVRGQQIERDQILARLDDALARNAVGAREAEARAASERAKLVASSARSEDVRAVEVRLRAARANEAYAHKVLADDRALAAKGAIPAAVVDGSLARFESVMGERRSLEQQLGELRAGGRVEAVAGAEATASAAVSTADIERNRVRQHQLVALERGEVLDIHVEPGEVVTPGLPVLTVADTSHPYVDIFVPQQDIDGVRVGEGAAIRVDSLAAPLLGSVERISRQTEFSPRFLYNEERANLVIRTRVRVADPERRLHAGTPAFVVLGP
jgi:HlyD family secretion protein